MSTNLETDYKSILLNGIDKESQITEDIFDYIYSSESAFERNKLIEEFRRKFAEYRRGEEFRKLLKAYEKDRIAYTKSRSKRPQNRACKEKDAEDIEFETLPDGSSRIKPVHEQKLDIESTECALELTEKGEVKNTLSNLIYIMENDPRVMNRLRLNTLSRMPDVYGGMPWDNGICVRQWTNNDDSNLVLFMEGYKLKMSQVRTMQLVDIVSDRNKYNPIIERLKSIEWDGKEHVSRLLPDYLGAEDNEYTAGVMRLFMKGLCSRAHKPGTKFDTMMILKGKQGDGKSTFARLLALDDAWFTDGIESVEGTRPREEIRGKWVVEFKELLGMRRAKDAEAIKGFIDTRSDTYRPAYGRRAEDFPRTCCFIGTTNKDTFLVDKTGNRRFLVINTDRSKATKSLFDRQAIDDFEQAWAEIMHEYHENGERFDLNIPENIRLHAEQENQKHLEEDPKIGMIENYLRDKDHVCIVEIWENALNGIGTPKRSESNEINEIITMCINGWKKDGKKTRFGKYGPQWGYSYQKEWRSTENTPFDVS